MIYLNCSCCGNTSWWGKQSFNHDAGFGTCSSCQDWINDRDKLKMDKMIQQLSKALKPANRTKFNAMDRKLQCSFVYESINKGLWSFAISTPTP